MIPDPDPVEGTAVLIVDDSVVVRRLVQRVVDDAEGLRSVGEASDGQRALALARSLRPDVMVLDLHMPGMDGFEVLGALRASPRGPRVIVFANVEPEDFAELDRQVHSAGAELVAKPTGVSDAAQAIQKIRECLLGPLRRGSRRHRPPTAGLHRVINAVVLASSTGGPHALEAVLGNMTDVPVPIFIVQHIADGFSGRLAARLDTITPLVVHETFDGQRPEPGHVYLGPGGLHFLVDRQGDGPVIRLRDLPPVNSCRPSADLLFESSAKVYGGDQLGLVLTGIGRDGFDGCRALSALGAPILVQDEETSVVWGMPGVVAKADLADEVLPIDAIAGRVQQLVLAGLRPSRPGRREP